MDLIEKYKFQEILIQLLKLKKDKRYRRGLLQAAASFGIIDQDCWQELTKLYL